MIAMVQLSQVLEMVKLVQHHILLGRIYYAGGARERRREKCGKWYVFFLCCSEGPRGQ